LSSTSVRDEGQWSSKENLASFWKLDSRPVQEADFPLAVFVGAVLDRHLSNEKNFCIAAFDGTAT
jgi:hypothetical protein